MKYMILFVVLFAAFCNSTAQVTPFEVPLPSESYNTLEAQSKLPSSHFENCSDNEFFHFNFSDGPVLFAGPTEGGGPQKVPVKDTYFLLMLILVAYAIKKRRECSACDS